MDTEGDDAVRGPRELLAAACTTEEESRQAAILAGLTAFGDARVFGLIEAEWERFSEVVQARLIESISGQPPTVAAVEFIGAVPTDILHLPARVVVTPADAPRPRGVERREGTADDRPHADQSPPAAALRPPASASRPTHWGRDRRHEPRSASLDGAWVARRGADGRRLFGCGGPQGTATPAGGPEAAAPRPEARGATPARAGSAPHLRL
jgi:hypothetical protein